MDHLSSENTGIPVWLATTPPPFHHADDNHFSGKPFSYETLEGALSILDAEVDLPFDVPGEMPFFRKTLALSFLFKFWGAFSVELNIPLDGEVTRTAHVDDIIGSIHCQPSSGRRDNSVRAFSCSLFSAIGDLAHPLTKL